MSLTSLGVCNLTTCKPQSYNQQCSQASTLSQHKNPGNPMAIQSLSFPTAILTEPAFCFPSLFKEKAFRIFCNAKKPPNCRAGKRVN